MKNTILSLFAIGGIVMIYWNWPCISLRLNGTPEIIAEMIESQSPSRVVILFGDQCTICQSGNVLYAIQSENNIYVFEQGTGHGEVQSFMETFEIMGTPIIDDGTVARTMTKFVNCEDGDRGWRQNFLIPVSDRGMDLDNIRTFN